jgi:hypothetical protein
MPEYLFPCVAEQPQHLRAFAPGCVDVNQAARHRARAPAPGTAVSANSYASSTAYSAYPDLPADGTHCFAILIAVVFTIILDLDRPFSGLIQEWVGANAAISDYARAC